MSKEVWQGYIILGYILLPIIALYNIIRKTTKTMSNWQVFFFYLFLIIIILELIEIFS